MTTTQLSDTTTTAATPTSAVAIPSFEDRAAAAIAALEAGDNPAPSDSAGEPAEATPPAPTQAAAAESGDATQDEAAKRAAERRERLAAAIAKTREQVDRKTHAAATDKMARDLAAAQARAEAAERAAEEAKRVAASRIDVETIDEAALFALAERRGIAPQKLGEWIQTAMTSPEKIAEARALQTTREHVDPKLAALEARIAAAEKRANDAEERQRAAEATAKARADEEQHTRAFITMVSQSAERAPLAAKLLEADRDEFMQMAEIAAERVPGMGAEALLDAVEDLLDTEGRKHAAKIAALYGFAPSAPATKTPTSQATASKTATTRAAAKANTVSNSLAQQRSAVLEEEDFAKLSLDERAAKLIYG